MLSDVLQDNSYVSYVTCCACTHSLSYLYYAFNHSISKHRV